MRELDTDKIHEQIVRQSFKIPYGFMEEIYYSKRTKKISFSSPMTKNSWTDSDDIVGTVEGSSIGDVEGYICTDDNDFIEVDDEQGEIAKGFDIENYYRYYGENSSIITYEEAMDRIIELAVDNGIEPWYQDVIDEIEIVEGKKCDNCNKKLEPDNWTKGGTLLEPKYYHYMECKT